MALIQRSCGYALRPTLSIADVQAAIEVIKRANPRVVVVVDNCYGEFTEDREPCSVRPTPSALTHARASGSAAVAARLWAPDGLAACRPVNAGTQL